MENKFRYIVKDHRTNKIMIFYINLADIEKTGIYALIPLTDYEIIGRDKFACVYNNQELYEHDLLKNDDKIMGVIYCDFSMRFEIIGVYGSVLLWTYLQENKNAILIGNNWLDRKLLENKNEI